MKKVGIIWVKDSINVGDDVQTMAMTELVQEIAPEAQISYFDRESLATADFSDLSHLIVSGWFLQNPSRFPIQFQGITPLFISFHLTSIKPAPEEVLSDSRMPLWKSVEPVGCRDKGTLRMFQSKGIASYFSACATLTLRPRSTSTSKPYILVVDPFYSTAKGHYEQHQMKRLLGDQQEFEVKVLQNMDDQRPTKSQETRFSETRELLNTISNARFVVTSRIHVALPALAMGTAVVFPHVGYDRNKSATDRFDGIVDLFHVIPEEHFPISSRKPLGKILRKLGMYKLTKSSLKHLIPDSIRQGKGNEQASKGIEHAEGIRQAVERYLQ